MGDHEYIIANDTLFRKIDVTDEHGRKFICKTEAIISKEAFIKCYEEWILHNDKEVKNG